MMKLTVMAILTLLLFAGTSNGQNCNCISAPADDMAASSLHANIVIDRVDRVKSFRGVVSKGEPLAKTLIEVFSDGEILAMDNTPDGSARKKNQMRVGACRTGEDGEFCFDYLTPGTYELRVTKEGHETISFIINFDPHNSRLTDKMIEVEMPVH